MPADIFNAAPNCCIVSKRTVDATQEMVYEAWTNPEHLKNWWGPAGFTNTFIEHDLRIGGIWKFIMHGPDKGNYPNECEFIKIEKPLLIAWKRISKPFFKVLATFEKVDYNTTHVVFKMIFDTAEECDKLKKFVVDKNEENFDRLQEELHKMTAQL